MVSEQKLVERVRRAFTGAKPRDLRVGIGDDAAVVGVSPRTEWIITTDAFIEDVHFRFALHPPHDAGYKALARATSDLAAKGARPRFFLMNLAVSNPSQGRWLDAFLRGMAEAARAFGLALIGGDTTKDERVAVNLTLLGTAASNRAILRSGARPGDVIFASGTLGQAELGFRLLERRRHTQAAWKPLLQRHLRPEPRLAVGWFLAQHRLATAMIDISDGLSTDLAHLCQASGVGAALNTGAIPKVSIPPGLRRRGLDPLTLALHGGDDYELLFTVSPRQVSRLPKAVAGVPLRMIGEVTRAKRLLLVDSDRNAVPLRPLGWDPFRR